MPSALGHPCNSGYFSRPTSMCSSRPSKKPSTKRTWRNPSPFGHQPVLGCDHVVVVKLGELKCAGRPKALAVLPCPIRVRQDNIILARVQRLARAEHLRLQNLATA